MTPLNFRGTPLQNSGSKRIGASQITLLALALLKFWIHILTSQQYGYFGDELNYIAASKRLAFGYVDFSPLIALVTALVRATLGESLLALHFLPAAAGMVLVLLAGLLARQLGARLFGQTLAALATLIVPHFLGTHGLLTVESFDLLFWNSAIYILILILEYDRPRLWVWLGLAVGLGLTNKITLLYFGSAMVIGLALTPARKYFRSPWLYLGGVLALAFLLPYVIWNAVNGWPTLEYLAVYRSKVYQASPLEFVFQQLLIIHPVNFPLWVTGLIYLFSKKGNRYRLIGWIYATLLIVFMLQSVRSYWLAAMYPVLLAAGAIWWERLQLMERFSWLKPACLSLLAIEGIVAAPMAITVLPLEMHVAYLQIMINTQTKYVSDETGLFPQHFADRFGWEEMAARVKTVYLSLSPEDQAIACIFAGNYEEAGALEFYGSKYKLPHVISGHNNYYLWGPGDCSGQVMILIGNSNLEGVKQSFLILQQVSQTQCEYCRRREDAVPIYIARRLKVPLAQLWQSLKSFP